MDFLDILQTFVKKNDGNKDVNLNDNSSNNGGKKEDEVFNNIIKIPKPVGRVFPETRSQMLYDRLLQELLQSQLLHQLPDHETLRTIHESLNTHSTPPFARMYTGNERIDYSHLCQLKNTLKNTHDLEDELVENYLSKESFLRMKRDKLGRISIHNYFYKHVLRRFFLFENLVDLVGMNADEGSEEEEEIFEDSELSSILRNGEKSRNGKRLLYNDLEYVNLEDFRSFLVDAVLQFDFVEKLDKDMINLYVLVCERKFLFHMPPKAIKIQFVKRKREVPSVGNTSIEEDEEEEEEVFPLVLLSLRHLVQLPCLVNFREVGADREVEDDDEEDDEEEELPGGHKKKKKKKMKASEDINNWFSRKSFLSLRDAFRDMDNEDKWSLNINQFKLFNNGSLSDFAVERIFECYCYPGDISSSNMNHNTPTTILSVHNHCNKNIINNNNTKPVEKRMRIEEFIDFILAYENVLEPQSIQYFWRVVDVKEQGYLDTKTIKYVFGYLVDGIFEECGVTPKMSDIINELMDMALTPYEQMKYKLKVRKKNVLKVGSEWILKLLDRKVFNSHNPYREEQEEEENEDNPDNEGEALRIMKAEEEEYGEEGGSTSPTRSPKKRMNRVLSASQK